MTASESGPTPAEERAKLLDGSIGYLREGLALDPNNVLLRHQLAGALEQQGDPNALLSYGKGFHGKASGKNFDLDQLASLEEAQAAYTLMNDELLRDKQQEIGPIYREITLRSALATTQRDLQELERRLALFRSVRGGLASARVDDATNPDLVGDIEFRVSRAYHSIEMVLDGPLSIGRAPPARAPSSEPATSAVSVDDGEAHAPATTPVPGGSVPPARNTESESATDGSHAQQTNGVRALAAAEGNLALVLEQGNLGIRANLGDESDPSIGIFDGRLWREQALKTPEHVMLAMGGSTLVYHGFDLFASSLRLTRQAAQLHETRVDLEDGRPVSVAVDSEGTIFAGLENGRVAELRVEHTPDRAPILSRVVASNFGFCTELAVSARSLIGRNDHGQAVRRKRDQPGEFTNLRPDNSQAVLAKAVIVRANEIGFCVAFDNGVLQLTYENPNTAIEVKRALDRKSTRDAAVAGKDEPDYSTPPDRKPEWRALDEISPGSESGDPDRPELRAEVKHFLTDGVRDVAFNCEQLVFLSTTGQVWRCALRLVVKEPLFPVGISESGLLAQEASAIAADNDRVLVGYRDGTVDEFNAADSYSVARKLTPARTPQ